MHTSLDSMLSYLTVSNLNVTGSHKLTQRDFAFEFFLVKLFSVLKCQHKIFAYVNEPMRPICVNKFNSSAHVLFVVVVFYFKADK